MVGPPPVCPDQDGYLGITVEVYEDHIRMLEMRVERDTVVAKKAKKKLKET